MNIRTELFRDKLPNVAPYCTIEATGWTGSQSGEVLATGDGTTVDFSGKVDLPPVNPLNSFTLHYTIGGTAYSVQADANGNFSDANVTGSVAQDGTWNATFNTAPDDATDITADYSYGIPPANLENALDPSNPNPSDWGWISTAGAVTVGDVVFHLQEEGLYLVNIRWGGYSSKANSIVTNVRIDIDPDPSNIFWSYIDSWGSIASTKEKVRSGVGMIIYGDKFEIYVKTNASDEIHWRLYDVWVFKLM